MSLAGKKAVFLDAGFTLLELVAPVEQVYLAAAGALGVEIPSDRFREHLGRIWEQRRAARSASRDLRSSESLERDAWRRFTRAVAEPFPDLARIHERWLARLVEHFDGPAAWRPAPGAGDLLDALAGRGLIVGVVSNWHSALHGILDGHALASRCDFVLTSAEVGYKKPHPRIFEAALGRARVPPAQALHVGDSWEEDILGARAAGISPVYFAPDSPVPHPDPSVPVLSSLPALLGMA